MASSASPAVAFPEATPITAAASRARILVVDDDAAFGGIVAEVLTARGYAAEAVNDPEKAIERARGGGYAAAVLDLVMPRLGGLELAERLREISPDIQLVLLTGHADLRSATAGMKHGVFAYLQKDEARMDVLEQTLEGAVSRWRLLQRQAQLVDDLEDANRRLRLLHEASAALAGEVHFDRLLCKAVELARRTCLARSARLVLLEPAEGAFVVTGAEGDGASTLLGMRLSPGEGVVALAAEGDEPLLVSAPAYHPAFSRRCDGLPSAPLGLVAAPVRHGTIRGALLVAGRTTGFFGSADQEILGALARQTAIALDNARQRDRSVNYFTHTSEILVSFLEALDVHHPGHSRGVAALSDLITRRLGLSDTERRTIHFGALLHDIGKVRLDAGLLSSSGTFGPEEKRSMRDHTRLGVELLRPISVFEDLLAIVNFHHERWDGRGYPSGLKAEAIPLGARVVAVADAFHAMGRGTPYRKPLSTAECIAQLEAGSGSQFDPRIVRLFIAAFRESGDPREARGQ